MAQNKEFLNSVRERLDTIYEKAEELNVREATRFKAMNDYIDSTDEESFDITEAFKFIEEGTAIAEEMTVLDEEMSELNLQLELVVAHTTGMGAEA